MHLHLGNMYCNQKTVDSTVPAGQEKDNVGTNYKPDAQGMLMLMQVSKG